MCTFLVQYSVLKDQSSTPITLTRPEGDLKGPHTCFCVSIGGPFARSVPPGQWICAGVQLHAVGLGGGHQKLRQTFNRGRESRKGG